MLRKQSLLQIRPSIETEPTAPSSIEYFQNHTLRPILKFQNEVLLAIFQHHIQKRKQVFFSKSSEQQSIYIKESIQKDVQVKNLLLGIVIGLFSVEELQHYQSNESELKRRLNNLIIQRLQSQVDWFVNT